MWVVLLSANVRPTNHVSDITMETAHLIYCILSAVDIDIVRVIFEKLHLFVRTTVERRSERSRFSLGFPVLITALCQYQGVEVNPTAPTRASINKMYIEIHCFPPKELEQPPKPQDHHHSPPPQHPPPADMPHHIFMEHLCQQNIAIHRGMLHLQVFLYHNVRGSHPGMPPEQFQTYLQWPGDNLIFSGGVEQLELDQHMMRR